MKVRDIPYRRYTIQEGRAAYAEVERLLDGAKNVEDVLAARRLYQQMTDDFDTAASLAYNRFSLDTRDEFYRAEMEYYDENTPYFEDIHTRYAARMLASPFRDELKKYVNPRVFSLYDASRRAFDERVTEDVQKENAEVTAYSRFMSDLLFDFDGQKMPLSVLSGKLNHSDPAVRRAAAEAIDRGLAVHADELDGFYDRLVALRDAIARKMGYASFTELGYWRMDRIDYDASMVASFRENVLRDVVPVVTRVKKEVAKRLGVPTITYADNSVYTEGEAPDPILDKAGMFAAAQTMYDDLDPEVGAFMRTMQQNEAFDVDAREGKWGGGYCTSFRNYRQPFILANFNGTASDVDVLTHEFGHALADYFHYKEGDLELDVGGMETAECHSMSMEFFAWKYMEPFFGANTAKYRVEHLLASLSFIPYGVMVDEFQHLVYASPAATPDERCAMWRGLEAKYRPWLDYTGLPYLGRGTRWQFQSHIFESPFYYIDYCLAQTVALSFLIESLDDYQGAFARYLTFVRTGGQKSFADLVKAAGLPSPFEPGALKRLADRVAELADRMIAEL
ncbi:MAG: M3 family oligoendopeptidase [Clostridia bacterium]|nr:M3 family oligoendopeptidase [Clostridia bacterium]